MPRRSKKVKVTERLRSLYLYLSIQSQLMDIAEEGTEEDRLYYKYIVARLGVEYMTARTARYLLRSEYRPTALYSVDDHITQALLGGTLVYSDEEFLMWFRVTRETFKKILPIFAKHSEFNHPKGQAKHIRPTTHLLVTLKYFGADGNGASSKKMRDMLQMGKGTVDNYINRTIDIILRHAEEYVFWPSAEERKNISERIRSKHSFPSCVGFIDSTHLGLAMKPEHCGEEYWTRKQSYAISALLVVDDRLRIRYINVGWPGSVHDNRVWSNSKPFLKPEEHFSDGEYLLGDSAFTNTRYMVSSYKRPGLATLCSDKKWFNDLLAKPRSGSENVIGVWKGRFPFLRNIRMRLKDKLSMQRIIKRVYASVILHNMLVDTPIDDKWLLDDDDSSDTSSDDEGEQVEIDDFRDFRGRDELRRTQIHSYLIHLLKS